MADNYRKTFVGIASTLTGQFQVQVEDEEVKDCTGTNMGLHSCDYSVGPVKSKKMVKKGSLDNPISQEQFVFLAGLNKHPNAFVVENYYIDGNGNGCLVVQSVDGKFESWCKAQVNYKLISDDGRISPVLRTIILSLCSFVQHVLNNRGYPQHFTMDDLYIKMMNGEPTLKVLLSDVRKGANQTRTDLTWNHVKAIINQCCSLQNVILSGDCMSFYDYIGRETKKAPLQTYPNAWTDADKSAYLVLIIQDAMASTKQYVEMSGIVWPTENGHIQPMLQLIIDHDEKTTYDTNVPWDYIRLCRNVTKKFDIPKDVQAMVTDRIGFLRKMEEWTPKIWTKLYETIGPLSLRL